MKACSHCLRTLRKQARPEQLSSTQPQARFLSIATTLQQQAQQRPQSQTDDVPPISTTTPKGTSNVTAGDPAQHAAAKPPKFPGRHAPPGRTPSNAAPEVPVSAMQKQIRGGLTPGSISMKLAQTLRSTAKSTTESYITYGLTELLYKSCAAQAPYTVPEDLRMGVYTGKGPPKNAREEDVGVPDDSVKGGKGAQSWWFREIGLEPTFSVWSQVTFLHMYILTVKMRTLESQKVFSDYQRYLLEHFSNAAEDKMALLHGMSARGIRNKFLKDLFQQWRGVLYAYDEGLVKGDAVLASAIWRNLWKADEDVDWEKVAMITAYTRRCIAGLADVSIQDIASGLKDSGDYWEAAQEGLPVIVDMNSRGVKEPVQ